MTNTERSRCHAELLAAMALDSLGSSGTALIDAALPDDVSIKLGALYDRAREALLAYIEEVETCL